MPTRKCKKGESISYFSHGVEKEKFTTGEKVIFDDRWNPWWRRLRGVIVSRESYGKSDCGKPCVGYYNIRAPGIPGYNLFNVPPQHVKKV